MGRKIPRRTLLLPQSGNREKAVTTHLLQSQLPGRANLALIDWKIINLYSNSSSPIYEEFVLLLSLGVFPFVCTLAETQVLAAVSQTLEHEGPLHGPEIYDMGHGRDAHPAVAGGSEVRLLRESQTKLVTYFYTIEFSDLLHGVRIWPFNFSTAAQIVRNRLTRICPYLTKRQGCRSYTLST